MIIKKTLLLLTILLVAFPVLAQDDDLLKLLEEEKTEEINYTFATFKTTRVINLHSVEQPADGVLDFRISHRFGRVNSGAYEFFGLDRSTIRLGLEYGLTDRFNIGIGRNSFEKIYDGFFKAKVLRQSTGARVMPVSVNLFSSAAITTLEWADTSRPNYFSSRLFYTNQLIIARKFSDNLSLQLSPTHIHRNLVSRTADENDVFALGFAGRYRLTRSITLNSEYIWILPGETANQTANSASIGVDIETGGHVFQLHFTNSLGMIEKSFVAQTDGRWDNGDIHFGFNISRVFTLKR
jgi:hypothetical protein